MINFPDTPTLAQIFTTAGSSWQWDGNKWEGATVAGGGPYLLLTGGTLTGQLTVNPNIVIGNPVTSPPATSLVINKTASTPQAATVVPNLWLAADSGAALMLLDVYGTSGNNITARRSRGTAAAPTSVQSLDTLFVINGQGRGATTYSGNQGQILLQAAEAWSDTAQGTQLSFSTTPIGTTAQAQRVYINRGVVIGNPAPDPGQGGLVLNANAAALPAPVAGTQLQLGNADSTPTTITIDAYGSAGQIVFRAAGGTAASPTAMTTGSQLGSISGRGCISAGTYNTVARAIVLMSASENWSATAQGAYTSFWTTPSGGTAVAEAMRIDHNGNVGIGTTGPSGKLHVVNNDSNLILDTPAANQTASISFRDGGNARWGLFTSASASHDFGLYNSTTASVSLTVQSSSGNVGIGTTAPAFKLHVHHATDVNFMLFNNGGRSALAALNDANNVWNPIDINPSGNVYLSSASGGVGIGTTTPGNQLEVGNGAAATRTVAAVNGGASGTSAGGMFLLRNGGSSIMAFGNASAIAGSAYDATAMIWATGNFTMAPVGNLALTPGGNVGIGTTGPQVKLDVRCVAAAGGVAGAFRSGPNGADSTSYMLAFSDFANSVVIGSIIRNGTNTVAYVTTSDRRLKDGITESKRGLDALMTIKVSDYKMGKTASQGLLAQDVAKVYPEAVHQGGKDPNLEPWMIDYGRLTPLIIKALQDLAAKVEALSPPPARRKAA